jgi:ATP-binding cassette subfamily B multidrug efflux pump
LYRLFEKLLHPYPEAEPPELPKTFFSFVWACTAGMRGYLVLLGVLSAAISTWDAWLFAVLGHVVDWLTRTPPG